MLAGIDVVEVGIWHLPPTLITVGDIALDALEIAHAGLARRAALDFFGFDETHFLTPLFQIAESGLTPAEELLRAYERRWKGNVDPAFEEYAY